MSKRLKYGLLALVLVSLAVFIYNTWSHQMALRDFSYLETIYPSERVEDLFAHFPKDFTIIHIREYEEAGKLPIRIRVQLDGDATTEHINGAVETYEVDANRNRKMLESIEVPYDAKTGLALPKESVAAPYLENFRTLVTQYDYDKKAFKGLEPINVYDNPSLGYYEERYNLTPSEGWTIDELDFSRYQYTIEFGRALSRLDNFFDNTIRIRLKETDHISGQGPVLTFISEVINSSRYKESP